MTEKHQCLSYCTGEFLHRCLSCWAVMCVFDGEHFQHLPGADFSVAKSCDEGHNCWFSNSYCDAQFTCCVEAIIPNQCMNIVCGLHRCCSAWLASVGPPPLYFSLLSKLWTCLINWLPFVASSPHTFQTSVNPYGTGDFCSNEFNHNHSMLSMYVHGIRLFALLLCWMCVTDWSTYDPVGDEQCHYPVGKARNSDSDKFKRRKIGGVAFVPTLIYVIMHRRIPSL